METTQFYLQEFLDIVLRRKRLIALFLVLVTVVITLGTLRQEKLYRAQTVIEVGVETPDISFYKEIVTASPRDWWSHETFYETQFKILRSRSLMSVVADRIIDEGVITGKSRGSLVSWLQASIGIQRQEKSRLVNITMDDTVPDRAAKISNLIADVYVEENLNKKIRAAKEGVEILSNQLELFRKEKEQSDHRLQEFKEEHKIVSLENKQNVVKANLVALNENLSRVKNERIRLEAKYWALKSIVDKSTDPEKLLGAVGSELMSNLKSEYDDLMRRYGELSKRYKEKHPDMIELKMKLESVRDSVLREAKAELAKMETDYLLVRAQERALLKNIEKQKKEALKIDALHLKMENITSAQTTNRTFYEGITKKLKEADLTGLIRSNNVRVVDRAIAPKYPIKPNVKANILMALVFGLLGGIGIAYLIEGMDSTVKTEDDVEKYSQLPLLGMIPLYKQKEGDDKTVELLPITESSSNISEMYRTVRTNISFLSTANGYKTFQITSAGAKDGKTTTAVNLAASLAQFGNKTLIIDLDLRKSRLNSVFGIDKENGITDFIIGEKPIKSFIRKTDIPNLDIITAGTLPPNPAELVGSHRLKDAIEELGHEYQTVIIDSSPIAPVTDSLIIAQLVDGVIMVAGAEITAKSLLRSSKDQLAKVQANILGVILNAVNIEKQKYLSKYYKYGYYRYGYNYKSEEEKENPRKVDA